MDIEAEARRYMDNPALLVDLCREVARQLEDGRNGATAAQLQEVSRTVANLERRGVPVPDGLRAEKLRLAGAQASAEESAEKLRGLVEGLGQVAAEFLGKGQGKPRRGVRSARGGERRHWLIPSNPAIYDAEAGFAKNGTLLWKQTTKVQPGDVVYIYVGVPVSVIQFKCEVLETDLPNEEENEVSHAETVMRLRPVRKYDATFFPMERMRQYGVSCVRGARNAPPELVEALESET